MLCFLADIHVSIGMCEMTSTLIIQSRRSLHSKLTENYDKIEVNSYYYKIGGEVNG